MLDDEMTSRSTELVEITDLRLAFSIEKTLGSEPNDCSITVYNLNEASRAALERRPLHVELLVGYEGEDLRRIFDGDLRWSESVPEGVRWVSSLQLGDGERVYRHARVSRSFRARTPLIDAVSEVARSMGFRPPRNLAAYPQMAIQFAAGVALSGKARHEFARLLKPYDIDWSIQDGALQILGRDDVRPDPDVIVSEETGLLGSPAFGAPPPKGKKPTLTFRSQLRAELVPGRVAQVRSRALQGGANRFKVVRAVLDGDTSPSGPFTTTCEATPV